MSHTIEISGGRGEGHEGRTPGDRYRAIDDGFTAQTWYCPPKSETIGKLVARVVFTLVVIPICFALAIIWL
jgi:hypothetical protein